METILILENILVYQWKKHIGVRHKLIWNYVEDGTVKIKFVRSEQNLTYPFTKNLSNRPFHLLTPRYIHR